LRLGCVTRAELVIYNCISYIISVQSFMPRVVLFKTQSEGNGSDAYKESFAQAGFEVRYIPVLQEEFHVDGLSQLISDKERDWGGVVITSKRGAEGWVQATKRYKVAASSSSTSEFQSAVAEGDSNR
jgi:uroporphyrinogen-III synthase